MKTTGVSSIPKFGLLFFWDTLIHSQEWRLPKGWKNLGESIFHYEDKWQVNRPHLDPKSITTHAKDPAELFRIFFVHYLGTGKPFSMSGRAQKPIGPKKVLKCISLGPAFIFLAINQTHLRLAFGCSTKLFSYPTGAIFWIIWIVIRHCQADDGGGVGRSQGERRRQAVELWRTGGEEKEWRPLLYSSAFYEPSIT